MVDGRPVNKEKMMQSPLYYLIDGASLMNLYSSEKTGQQLSKPGLLNREKTRQQEQPDRLTYIAQPKDIKCPNCLQKMEKGK